MRLELACHLGTTSGRADSCQELSRQVDAGEAECLAVAVTRGYTFLSDDFAARRVAKTRGVAISGTLGVLLLLVDRH